jgi:hypothetical protein
MKQPSVITTPQQHKKILLDEDDYRAIPDHLTDYRQPPMNLNPGLLDTGLKTYVNPLLVGYVPQLWLPVPPITQHTQEAAEQAHLRKKAFLHSDNASGGKLAQHLAEILRKHDTPAEAAQHTAHNYAASIVSQPAPKKGWPFRKQPTDEALDQVERAEPTSFVHETYYHHPEKRKHVVHRRPKLGDSNASSPAAFLGQRQSSSDHLLRVSSASTPVLDHKNL